MKRRPFLLLFLLLTSALAYAEVPIPRAATGLELGVARLSTGSKSLIGTSWIYMFEYQADPYLSFFGQAGNSQGQEGRTKLEQTQFTGGLEFYLLPRFGFQLGLANSVIETEINNKHQKVTELGPMVGTNIYYPVGIFLIGASATVTRSSSMNSTAIRGMVLIEI